MDSLLKANVPKESAFKILSTPSEKSSDIYQIIEEPAPEGESRHPAIIYINDLETDPMYSNWPHTVAEVTPSVQGLTCRFSVVSGLALSALLARTCSQMWLLLTLLPLRASTLDS